MGAQHAPPTSHPLPSSAETPLKVFSQAKHPARQSPAGTKPGQTEVPRDERWPGTLAASVLQERVRIIQVIHRSIQPRRQP